ncbi:MAG: sensor histidine kinase, partial [Flavobacteriaceae bacterium]
LKEGQMIIYPHGIDHISVSFEQKILELALSNLVYNAIKYSAEHTQIEIRVRTENNRLELDIIDQGIGIPAQEQKHIFNRYFRAENALLSQGTGIGLSITKQHLENLGASLSFVSEENKGSIFTIIIPENMAMEAPS